MVSAQAAPAHAWLEREEQLHPLARPAPLQALWPVVHSYVKCPNSSNFLTLPLQQQDVYKIVQQKKKQKLIKVLNPPYFTLFMIVLMMCMHWAGGTNTRMALQFGRLEVWHQPWRVLSYSVVHSGNTHLALNAIIALVIGWRLEVEQGRWRTATVWCGGALGGSFAAGLLQPSMHVVGASAAVYAMLTAHLANVCLRFGHIPLWWFRPLSVFVLAAVEVSLSVLHGSYTADSRVAWSAHAFGAAVGLPLAFLVFIGENKSERCILICRVVSAITVVCGVFVVGVIYAACYKNDTSDKS